MSGPESGPVGMTAMRSKGSNGLFTQNATLSGADIRADTQHSAALRNTPTQHA